MKTYTHDDLVNMAAKWLRARGCAIVITEMSGGWGIDEIPDAIGWNGESTMLIECKASRQDFLSDSKKPFRSSIGMGTFRYYLAPEGVAYHFELPLRWGLLEFKNKHNHPKIIKEASMQPVKNWLGEMSILCSALRRIGGLREEGISVKVYQWSTKNTATLGIKREEES